MRAELLESYLVEEVGTIASTRIREAVDSFEDRDHRDWHFLGASPGEPTVGGILSKDISAEDAKEIRAKAYKLYYTNPYARGIIRTFKKFVFGQGVTFELDEKNESKKKKATEYLEEWQDVNSWALSQKEACERAFRDGETFLYNRYLASGKIPRLEFIEPDDVDHEEEDKRYGIQRDPKDPTHVLAYWVKKNNPKAGEKKYIQHSEDEIVHIKICVDRNVKRGRSIYEPVFQHITYHADWLRDRIILNKVRNAVALVRHVEGTQVQGETVRVGGGGAQANSRSKGKNTQRMFRPGSIFNAGPGVKYEMLSANLGASDAANDGRNILLAIAVGIGFPEMFLTGDFTNANYSSSLTAQNPFVREFEDWQNFFDHYIRLQIKQVLQLGIKAGLVDKSTSLKVKPEWPPLKWEDIVALSTALGQLYFNQVISKHTYSARLGFDYDEEQDLLQQEQKDEASTFGDNDDDLGDKEEPKEQPLLHSDVEEGEGKKSQVKSKGKKRSKSTGKKSKPKKR